MHFRFGHTRHNGVYTLIVFAIFLIAYIIYRIVSEKFVYKLYNSSSSVDCETFPESPACQPPPEAEPINTNLATCTPANGVWSIPNSDQLGRSKLASPCCQPPAFNLSTGMKTCDDQLDTSDPIEKCISDCCGFATNEANNYDPSWYQMARCGCSLWCYNQDVPHFKKYGTAIHYISGDIAEAQTGDSGNFI